MLSWDALIQFHDFKYFPNADNLQMSISNLDFIWTLDTYVQMLDNINSTSNKHDKSQSYNI